MAELAGERALGRNYELTATRSREAVERSGSKDELVVRTERVNTLDLVPENPCS